MEASDWFTELVEDREQAAPWFTLERVAYVAVAALAALLRCFQLGLRPLGEGEAQQALAAWRFVEGQVQAAPAGTVPALFTGNVIGFSLLGAGDAVARWLPVLAGMILVLLPYGLRHRLGRGGALAASLLLALSPSAVFWARSLDGAILVATCGLALVVGLVGYVDTRRPGYLYLAAAALGVGLCAGPGIYSLILILALFCLLLYLGERLLGRETGWSSLVVAWWALRGEKGLPARAGAVLAATFGLVAMTLVLHPAGVGHAADLLGAWAQSFLPQAGGQPPSAIGGQPPSAIGGQPWLYPLLLLLRYEMLVLVLGLVEVGAWLAAGRSGRREVVRAGSSLPFDALLLFWAAAALLIVVLSGQRPAGNLLLVVVPLALLAGRGVERAWRWIDRRGLWFDGGLAALIALVLGIFFYLWLAAYGQSSQAATVSAAGITLYASTSYLLLASVALLLLLALGVAAWLWRGADVVLAGGWLAVLVFLGLFGFKSAWGLAVSRSSDPRELMILQATAPEVRLLVEQLQDLSLDQQGDAHTLPLTVDAATGPVVAWYLRDFGQQRVVDDLSAPPDTVAAVTLAVQDLPIGETFRGQGFVLRSHWLPWGLWGQGLVRWLLFGEANLPVVDRQVVLWVASQPPSAIGGQAGQ